MPTHRQLLRAARRPRWLPYTAKTVPNRRDIVRELNEAFAIAKRNAGGGFDRADAIDAAMPIIDRLLKQIKELQ